LIYLRLCSNTPIEQSFTLIEHTPMLKYSNRTVTFGIRIIKNPLYSAVWTIPLGLSHREGLKFQTFGMKRTVSHREGLEFQTFGMKPLKRTVWVVTGYHSSIQVSFKYIQCVYHHCYTCLENPSNSKISIIYPAGRQSCLYLIEVCMTFIYIGVEYY